MKNGQARILFATYQLAKEGLDIPRLDRLVLATPTRNKVIVQQSIGRIQRPAPGKTEALVLDIVFTDGGRTQRTEVDLTEALADFNGDMTTAYRVTGTLETPVGMEEGKGEITGWETVEGGDASAEM